MTSKIQQFLTTNTQSNRPYKLAVVMAEFNREINTNLLEGVMGFCKDAKLAFDSSTDVYSVPGSYELALTSELLAERHHYDAIITIGTIIKGDTDHYESIMTGVSQAIWNASLRTHTPIIFGVLMVQKMADAIARSRIFPNDPFPFANNYGYEWAHAAYKWLATLDHIQRLQPTPKEEP